MSCPCGAKEAGTCCEACLAAFPRCAIDVPGWLALCGVPCCQSQPCDASPLPAACGTLCSSCCCRVTTPGVPSEDVSDLMECGNDPCWIVRACSCSGQKRTFDSWPHPLPPSAFFDICCCPLCSVSRQWNAFRMRRDECDAAKCISGCCLLPCVVPALRYRVLSRYHVHERGCTTCVTGMFCPLCTLCYTHMLLSDNGHWPGATCLSTPDPGGATLIKVASRPPDGMKLLDVTSTPVGDTSPRAPPHESKPAAPVPASTATSGASSKKNPLAGASDASPRTAAKKTGGAAATSTTDTPKKATTAATSTATSVETPPAAKKTAASSGATTTGSATKAKASAAASPPKSGRK